MSVRDQLTLFVPAPDNLPLEVLRQRLDPVQHALIAAHVTLCREEELSGLTPAELPQRLVSAAAAEITLDFGAPQGFDGHGVLLPCVAGTDAFHALRRAVLGRVDVREASAHITLAHPRNPKAAGNTSAGVATVIAALPDPLRWTFSSVCWIQQVQGGPWTLLTRQPLVPRHAPNATCRTHSEPTGHE